MDDNLQTALTSLGLAYSWINGQGDDYGNGCVVSDGMGGHYEEALTGDHDLYLILTEAQDADRLAYLQHLDALMETIAKGDLLCAQCPRPAGGLCQRPAKAAGLEGPSRCPQDVPVIHRAAHARLVRRGRCSCLFAKDSPDEQLHVLFAEPVGCVAHVLGR